ncbi:MAG: LamG domain-containing protein [Micromonosporaceae bacterium]
MRGFPGKLPKIPKGKRIWFGLAAGLVGMVITAVALAGPASAAPTAPVVTSDIYLENCDACGGVGVTGTFTFSSSSDATVYLWGFSDPPMTPATPAQPGGSVTVQWTPTSDGPQTLYVVSQDADGFSSPRTSYSFYVTPLSPLVASWLLRDPPGSTTLADDTGQGHTAQLDRGALGVPWRIPSANVGSFTSLRLDGEPGAGATAESLVATDGSFTVTAWVRLTDKDATRTAISQDGEHTAGFELQYAKGCDCWQLLLPDTDKAKPRTVAAKADRRVARNVWTHLTGWYDSVTGTARIYVDGTLAGSATRSASPWPANGPLRIGRGEWDDRAAHFWAGDLAEVRIWNRALLDDEIADQFDPGGLTSKAADWGFEEVDSPFAFDASGYANDLDVFPGARVPPSGAGHTGAGLRLDGSTGYAATLGPVVYTDQTFSVSAWVRLTDGSVPRTAISWQSSTESAFALGYADGHWVFDALAGDAAGAAVTRAISPSPAALNRYVHLVATYDATNQQIQLFVDDELAASKNFVKAFAATGPVIIGRNTHGGTGTGFWHGDLDEVSIYARVVTATA